MSDTGISHIPDVSASTTVSNGTLGWSGYPYTTGIGQTMNQCWYCGVWYSGTHYHVGPHDPPRYSCGAADHDYAQLKQPTGGKPRLFCRKCGTTKDV